MMRASSKPSTCHQYRARNLCKRRRFKQGYMAGEWRSKLLTGDYEATRQHNLLCVLLSSPIAEE